MGVPLDAHSVTVKRMAKPRAKTGKSKTHEKQIIA